MPITINGSGTITGASTLATTVASPTLTTPTIDSAQFPTVSGTAPLYPARAWVIFNGTGTVAITASGNVSSITDNGVGNYTVNFTTAMSDGNFAVGAITNSTTGDASRPIVPVRTGSSTSSVVIQTVGTFNNNTNVDCSVVTVTVHR